MISSLITTENVKLYPKGFSVNDFDVAAGKIDRLQALDRRKQVGLRNQDPV
jgi:hypothetical protein